jgi:hypothetical protein
MFGVSINHEITSTSGRDSWHVPVQIEDVAIRGLVMFLGFVTSLGIGIKCGFAKTHGIEKCWEPLLSQKILISL